MTFESLADFLDPDDPNRTIEGHPGPMRVMITARKSVVTLQNPLSMGKHAACWHCS